MNLHATTSHNEGILPTAIVGTFQHNDYGLLKRIIQTSIEVGFKGFDTAPSYENQEYLGRALVECMKLYAVDREDLYVIDKIDAWQMQETRGRIEPYVDDALRKLRVDYLDVLLIHWPFPQYFTETWKTCIDVYRKGKAKAIGVCNVRERHVFNLMEATGFKPHVVQIERHPLNTSESILKFNQERHIITQAYSPVARMMPALANSELIRDIAEKYQRTKGQIIMRWHIDTGAIPVFMTRKTERLKEYSKIVEFELDSEDVFAISSLNIDYKIFLESMACPGF